MIHSLLKLLELNSNWVELYEITGELHFPSDDADHGHLQESMQQMKESLRKHRRSDPSGGLWRTVRIPVDVPHKNIVASVSLKISPEVLQDSKPIYAGQPIPATVTIHTSFHWGTSHGDPHRQYAMQYDVEEMVKEWLVSGRKRGNFMASVSARVHAWSR
ncbi:hypothetical protein PQX77_004656 [Marasmius sp. AFHP31]|nr:hypothetical protein PQX77_004656 [Marasmius sp. AFHP31]